MVENKKIHVANCNYKSHSLKVTKIKMHYLDYIEELIKAGF